jgi:hypothetical protein
MLDFVANNLDDDDEIEDDRSTKDKEEEESSHLRCPTDNWCNTLTPKSSKVVYDRDK